MQTDIGSLLGWRRLTPTITLQDACCSDELVTLKIPLNAIARDPGTAAAAARLLDAVLRTVEVSCHFAALPTLLPPIERLQASSGVVVRLCQLPCCFVL